MVVDTLAHEGAAERALGSLTLLCLVMARMLAPPLWQGTARQPAGGADPTGGKAVGAAAQFLHRELADCAASLPALTGGGGIYPLTHAVTSVYGGQPVLAWERALLGSVATL